MTRGAQRRICWTIAAIGGVWPWLACGGTPDTGARIEVVNGAGARAPEFLRIDWANSERVLFHDRRVPETASLDPKASPLAVIRIASCDTTDPLRTIHVQGIAGNELVSRGDGTVHLVPGTWQETTIVLMAPGDAPADGGITDGGEVPTDTATIDGLAEDSGPARDVARAPDAASVDTGTEGAADAATDLALAHDGSVDSAANGPPPVVISASADSYVEQGQTAATQNHGTATTLEVKTQTGQDNNRVAYFRFELPVFVGTFSGATLRVYGKSDKGTSMDSAYAVLDESWTEAGITWNNKPALGTKLGTVSVGTVPQYRVWTVTSFFMAQIGAGRSTINFAVSMDGDTPNSPDTFNSREAASNPPQLVLTR